MRRTLQLSLSTLAVAALFALSTGVASAHAASTVYMKVDKPAHGARHHGGGSNNLFYHGGAIDQNAVVFLDYWGSQWATGFSTGSYSSATAQTYIQDFFDNVGGSSWANSTTQ